jgi:hypothetical protein
MDIRMLVLPCRRMNCDMSIHHTILQHVQKEAPQLVANSMQLEPSVAV